MLTTLFETQTAVMEECVKSRSLEVGDATSRVNNGIITHVTCARWLKTANEPSSESHRTTHSRTSGPRCCQPLKKRQVPKQVFTSLSRVFLMCIRFNLTSTLVSVVVAPKTLRSSRLDWCETLRHFSWTYSFALLVLVCVVFVSKFGILVSSLLGSCIRTAASPPDRRSAWN